MAKKVFLLLGGIVGGDGWLTSRGMLTVRDMLTKVPTVTVQTYSWSNWQKAAYDMAQAPSSDQKILIGYSGGGSRSTYLSRTYPKLEVDCLIGYDPSPIPQCLPLLDNIKEAYCYYNAKPRLWWPGIGQLGGGTFKSISGKVPIHVEPINGGQGQFHLWVQNNMSLHNRTVAIVRAL